MLDNYANPDGQVIPPPLTPAGTPTVPTVAPTTGGGGASFGNLNDPAVWMALVNNPQQLAAWVTAQSPQLFASRPDLLQYYVRQIQAQPGANPTEQAGSANYWRTEKILKDPNLTGGSSFFGNYGGSGVGGNGSSNLGDFGSFATPYGKTFTAPTAEQARNTPGYQFDVEEGIKGIDRGAAARGTMLNGGERKDILNYAMGLADTTYGKTYDRALGEYSQAYNIFRNDRNDIFGEYDRLASRGTSAANGATA